MDNRGYIFTTDAVLALVIFFVIAGSILTYYTLPSYMGADHQHLEAEADSALALLTSDGDLHAAILKINSNDTQKQEEGKQLLNDKLRLILPSDVAYDLQVDDVSISDSKGINTPDDRVSRYTVMSAPSEGWLGRAWYKMEDVQFKPESINTTQTLWTFHNYLNSFSYWQSSHLKDTYWGKDGSGKPVPIEFSIPSDAVLKNAYYIMGCQQNDKGKRSLRNTTKFRLDKNGKPEYQKVNVGWNSGKWYPLNGDWNDNNTIWSYGSFYLLPGVLSGSSNIQTNIPMKEDTPYIDNVIYTTTLPQGTYPELEAVPSFAFNLHINDNIVFANISDYPGSPFNYLYRRDNDPSREPVFNGIGDIPIESLYNGLNNFYVEFIGASSNHNLPWFSILGDYKTSILVPEGINTDRFPSEKDSKKYYCAGAGSKDMTFTYDLLTGARETIPKERRISFNDYHEHDSIQGGVNYANGTPFRIDKPGLSKDGSAIAQEYPIDLTPEGNEKITSKNIRVVDAYAVINTYGATDKVLVEVYNGTDWHDVFYSGRNTGVESGGGGYGNTPGTVYIPCEYLSPNVVNKLRVTVWDDANGNGYDFVGLVDTYAVVSFTSLPIGWDTYPFVSYQSKTNETEPHCTLNQTQSFDIGTNPNAEKIMFFFGVGLDTTNVKLEVSDKPDMSNPKTLYENKTIPFALDIGSIDAEDNPIFTTGSSGNYTGKPGKYYAKLTVETEDAWRSGDEQRDNGNAREKTDSAACEIFSGSRIAVIYPKFLDNEWVNEYSDTADSAKKKAVETLIETMMSSGYSVDPNLIQSEALYTGDMPNTVPIRLDLWRS